MYRHSMSNTPGLQANPASLSSATSNDAAASMIEQQRIAYTAVAASLGWSGWGSPVGLGILLAATGFFILCLHWAGIVH
jgi:hypothetical protein